MNIFKKDTEKHTNKLPMTGKVRKGFRIYCTAIMGAALILGTSVTAFAAGDPITVVNNLSSFIFGLIRAIGLMLLKRARKSVRYGRTRRQTASGSVPPSHSAISRTHRIRRTGW